MNLDKIETSATVLGDCPTHQQSSGRGEETGSSLHAEFEEERKDVNDDRGEPEGQFILSMLFGINFAHNVFETSSEKTTFFVFPGRQRFIVVFSLATRNLS